MPDAQRNTEGQELCLACGLCCTGVWFSHVNLEPEEVDPARHAGLEVEIVDGQPRSPQSCALHRDGSCSGYGKWRPAACVAFRCQLLDEFEKGRWSFDQALGHVKAVQAMAEQLRFELGEKSRGLLGKRFLMRVAGQADGAPPGSACSPAAQLDAFALNRYYEKYFRPPRIDDPEK